MEITLAITVVLISLLSGYMIGYTAASQHEGNIYEKLDKEYNVGYQHGYNDALDDMKEN